MDRRHALNQTTVSHLRELNKTTVSRLRALNRAKAYDSQLATYHRSGRVPPAFGVYASLTTECGNSASRIQIPTYTEVS